MSDLNNLKELFRGRHFDGEVIVLCVRWHLRYKLSFRDFVEMMAERGLHGSGANRYVSHEKVGERLRSMQREPYSRVQAHLGL